MILLPAEVELDFCQHVFSRVRLVVYFQLKLTELCLFIETWLFVSLIGWSSVNKLPVL